MTRTSQYLCKCGKALERERVIRAERQQMGPITIGFVCECSPGLPLSMSYEFSGMTLDALIGTMQLPWVSPITPRVIEDDDPDLLLFRWELDQIGDWDELVHWMEITA